MAASIARHIFFDGKGRSIVFEEGRMRRLEPGKEECKDNQDQVLWRMNGQHRSSY